MNTNSTHDRIQARLKSGDGCDAFCTFPNKNRMKVSVLDYDQKLDQYYVLYCMDSRRGFDHTVWVDASYLN